MFFAPGRRTFGGNPFGCLSRGHGTVLRELVGRVSECTVSKGQFMSSVHAEMIDKSSCDLQRRVMNFLAQRGVSSLRRLNVKAEGGTVTLHGTVRSFYERQLCLCCCQHVAGVVKLVDELKVEYPERQHAEPTEALIDGQNAIEDGCPSDAPIMVNRPAAIVPRRRQPLRR